MADLTSAIVQEALGGKGFALLALGSLKGVELSVWVAYGFSSFGTPENAATLTLAELVDLTGYSKNSVSAARARLERQGWLVRLEESSRDNAGRFEPGPFRLVSDPWRLNYLRWKESMRSLKKRRDKQLLAETTLGR